MVINTNVSAMNSSRLLAGANANLSKSLARLSSGVRIISPEDDAAGLAQSIKFDAQINRNSAAKNNIENAVSFSSTQDGFLQGVVKALDRMSELTVRANDPTKTNADRSNYQVEFATLQSYISSAGSKEFNGVSLFNSASLGVTIDSDAGTFGMTSVDLLGTLGANGLDVLSAASVSTTTGAVASLGIIKSAIQSLARMRADVGGNVQRLKFTSDQLSVMNENLTTANMRIKDVDVAEESTQFARYNILVQSGTAMLAQANIMPQSALRLLG